MLIFGMTIVTLGSLANELKTKFELSNYDSGTLFSILPIGLIVGSLRFTHGYFLSPLYGCQKICGIKRDSRAAFLRAGAKTGFCDNLQAAALGERVIRQ